MNPMNSKINSTTSTLTISTDAIPFILSMQPRYLSLSLTLYDMGKDTSDGVIVYLNPTNKRSIIERLHWDQINTLNHALVCLNKAGVIKRLCIGVYIINPYIFRSTPSLPAIADSFLDIRNLTFDSAIALNSAKRIKEVHIAPAV